MTYCVGLNLKHGLIFMSDTRTNAGLDNISVFRKMHSWEIPGERVITLLTAGNLATTQAVISLLEERNKSADERIPYLLQAPSTFQAAQIVADTLREVIARQAETGQKADSTFNATIILGGQIKGGAPRLFLIYPEGNFIEAGNDTPFFQIGETKYGRPILVRAYDPDMSVEDAIKLLTVSFDSTVKANLSVSPPFDIQIIEKDSYRLGRSWRMEADDPYYTTVSQNWGEALKAALESLPAFHFD